jgi:hypothetical protein
MRLLRVVAVAVLGCTAASSKIHHAEVEGIQRELHPIAGSDKRYPSQPCLPGWAWFKNADRSEKAGSCIKIIEYDMTPSGPFATFDDACDAEAHNAKAASFRSKQSAAGTGLLAFIVANLGTYSFATIGCSQYSGSPTGEGKTGLHWQWNDGTSASNLNCPDPSTGTCAHTSVWGAGIYSSSLFGPLESGLSEGSDSGDSDVFSQEPT